MQMAKLPSKMGKVYNVKRQAWYLSGYLSKEGFERYHFSGGWVFTGWIGFSQWFKREFGDYPLQSRLNLFSFHTMSGVSQDREIVLNRGIDFYSWFFLFLVRFRNLHIDFILYLLYSSLEKRRQATSAFSTSYMWSRQVSFYARRKSPAPLPPPPL